MQRSLTTSLHGGGDACKLLGAGASSLLCAMDFPPEVRELVQQLKSAGMQIDESNPQEVMQAGCRPRGMPMAHVKAYQMLYNVVCFFPGLLGALFRVELQGSELKHGIVRRPSC